MGAFETFADALLVRGRSFSEEDQNEFLERIGAASQTSIEEIKMSAFIPDGNPYQRAFADGAGVICDLDTSQSEAISLDLRGIFTGSAVAYEKSNDGTEWIPVEGYAESPSANRGQTQASGAGFFIIMPTSSMRFRVRASVIGFDTISVFVAMLSKVPKIFREINVAVGRSAHDAAVADPPVRVGARARSTNLAAVASDDATDLVATTQGVMVSRPYSIPEVEWSHAGAASGIVNTTTAVQIKAAAASGVRNYITGITIQAEPLGTATEFVIRNGAGGAVLFRMKIPTTGLALTPIVFSSPIKSSAATLLEVATLTASGTGAVYFNANGYEAA